MSATRNVEVAIVGAGPVGLLLACELSLAGIRPIVIERLAEPNAAPKARGIGVLAHEALRRRGLGPELDRAHEQGTAALEREHGTTRAHFAWIHKLDPDQADPGRRGALIAQPELEHILRRRAAEHDIEVLYSTTLTGLDGLGEAAGTQPLRLTLETPDGQEQIEAPYVVGCDGAHSSVRTLAGFRFPGTEASMTVRHARARVLGRERLPQPGRLPHGTLFHDTDMIATFDFAEADYDRAAPLTAEEMRASVRRVTGVDIEISQFQGGLRFTDRAAQAETYRQGRVLLAGDAAHVHSPNGGQGLNLGLMDAVNLGWKLAAVIRGAQPSTLLAGYTDERHPVAAGVLHNTRAQSALLSPGPHVDALREIMADLMDLPEVNRHLSRLLSGVEHRYAMPYPNSHPLVGKHCPPLHVNGTPLYETMHDPRPVLLRPAGFGPAVDRNVRELEVTSIDRDDLAAALIRPDGVIAWAASATADTADPTFHQALETWC